MAAEEEEEDTGEVADAGDVQKTLNKMLDKVCGKKKVDDDEDVATIMRKPIDFTKSGELVSVSWDRFVLLLYVDVCMILCSSAFLYLIDC